MPRAYASIGSNIDRERSVRAALAALRERFGVLAVSPVYETEPVGMPGEPFYNLVAGFDTDWAAERLDAAFKAIETQLGRTSESHGFAPRTVDIDLLTLGDERRTVKPVLPRGEILEHAFVLRPLADLAPDERHPTDGRTYAALWAAFDGATDMVRLDFRPD